jgi:3-methyladenine DNA glycosylase AlkD
MTIATVTVEAGMAELEQLGTEQNRTIYRRHGVNEPLFGVSYAHLDRLTRRIKTDQALAEGLWATGNHDARILATRVADPAAMDDRLLTRWLADLDNYVQADAFATLAVRSPQAWRHAETWLRADDELTARAGWHLLALLTQHDPQLVDGFFAAYLPIIERGIHTRPNRVREGMNNALIAIGARSDDLAAEAVAAAARIGRVQVDHGQTNCKTPDAATAIVKTRAYRQKRAGQSTGQRRPEREAGD